jgi:prevent-host-death family protein
MIKLKETRTPLNVWQLQDAKARLSEVIRVTERSPQVITVHGRKTAVLVSFDVYRKITRPGASFFDAIRRLPYSDVELKLEWDEFSKIHKVLS